ncbi:PREDICTED: uncharacterized protein LOC106117988 [Papilio xuthus]|uniref:Uncharacterized protein LOC106117988 n=1 Tax=Papilio xuthus TaxID=66420 RepID=A0AAJ7E9E7_PAPXU|nr:PREDICTED: uncharacterized protein LOC106117988 [Papilio xuthus]
MDEEIKICENCNREIPAVNYTIHSVHCARNIRMCPVCKEPVPLTELEEHTEKLHKLLPCKQCGEKVRGTDMEDHIRDSCDRTIQSCRWCELELSRRELPLHEGYCGTRTEECEQCGEFVMHKYRQLHLDSNHGFVRLDDDPVPRARVNRQRMDASTITPSVFASGFGMTPYQRPADRLPRLLDLPEQPPAVNPELARLFNSITEAHITNAYYNNARFNRTVSPRSPDAYPNLGPYNDGRILNQWQQNISSNWPRNNFAQVNAPGVSGIRNNDFKPPQRGAIKKRKAPNPPNTQSQPDQPQPQAAPAARPYSLFSFTSNSTPNTPISSPMTGPTSSVTSGPIQGPNHGPFPGPYNRRNTPQSPDDNAPGRANTNDRVSEATSTEEQKERPIRANPVNLPAKKSEIDRIQKEDMNKPDDFKDVKPMTSEEFMKRFRQLQLDKTEETSPPERFSRREESPRERFFKREDSSPPDRFFSPTPGDRFNAIKSSLKELRRGLNEVTAPYNNNNNANERGNAPCDKPDTESSNSTSDGDDEVAGGVQAGWEDEARGGDEAAGGEAACALDIIDVKLPCEFCGELIQANDLVQHQTGCRPDLAQFRPVVTLQGMSEDHQIPYIPCEFCAHHLPLNLIDDHQERCSRMMNRMN